MSDTNDNTNQTQQAANPVQLPLGVRDNNPGNIIVNPRIRWLNEITPRDGITKFCVFRAPENGIRALTIILHEYRYIHNLITTDEIIARYCPINPREHSNDPIGYAKTVAAGLNILPTDTIEFNTWDFTMLFVAEIIKVECSQYQYPNAILKAGVVSGFMFFQAK